MTLANPRLTTKKRAGFSMLELLVVVAIILIIGSIVIPSTANTLQNYRVVGDARGIAAEMALARMRAASSFTKARLNFDLTANTYQLEIWNKSSNGGAGAYQVEGAAYPLSQNVSFGFGSLTAPAGGQSTIAQPSPSQITFGSRGFSVNSSGTPIGTAAIYLRNTRGLVCAITVGFAGQATAWVYNGSAWKRM